jgi:Domain of unknown function (DUF3597)
LARPVFDRAQLQPRHEVAKGNGKTLALAFGTAGSAAINVGPFFSARATQRINSIEELAMSIFGNIMSSIFRHGAAQAQPKPAGSGTAASPTMSGGAATPSGSPAAPPSQGQSQVDVAAVLNNLAGQNKEKLDWRRSIVDLMKLLKLDSSLSARQELAKELHYSGDTKDTAAMNVWLHRQVMIKLAENGGKVPDDLRK